MSSGPAGGEWPGRARVRFICLAVLALSLLLLGVSFATFDGSRTAFGPALGADFAGFYAAGTLLREYPPERLYDFELQDRLYHRTLPDAPPEERLPYVYPPFFTLPFRALAALPYPWAYAAWLTFSVGLTLAGLGLLRARLPDVPRANWSIAVLLALSFEPLVMECWLGGQTSPFGFFVFALALYWDDRGRPALAGLALALALYKPPLLLLVLPLLVVARRWRVVAGFAAGGLGLAGASLLAVGEGGCLAYFRLLTGFARLSMGNDPGFPRWKYVDLASFVRLLFGELSPAAWLPILAAVAIGLLFLARLWWRYRRLGPDGRKLAWAAALTATLVLNVYVGVYDTLLVVPAVLLTFDAVRDTVGGVPPGLRVFLVLLYVVPWVSQHLAMAIGFQPYTLALAALGAYQVRVAISAPRRGDAAGPDEEPGPRSRPETAGCEAAARLRIATREGET
jgi:hypothetical protein